MELPQQRDFIRWILAGKPIPSVIFSEFDGKRCVLDGQQRLTTIHRYRNGKFRVDERYYNDLTEDMKEDFKDFNVAVQEFVLEDGDDDFDVINTFSVLNAGQQLSLGEKVYALESIYPVIKLAHDLFFPRRDDQENSYQDRSQRWGEIFGEIKNDKRKKEYALFVRLVISGLAGKTVPQTTEFGKMKKYFERDIPNNDYSPLLVCMDKFMALGEEDTTNYLRAKRLGIPTLKNINAPWATCALPESHQVIQTISQKFGSPKEMWKRFFLLLSENNVVKEEWAKKIDKKLKVQLQYVISKLEEQ